MAKIVGVHKSTISREYKRNITKRVFTDGPNSGELTFRFKRPKGVHQYSADPLLAPERWVSIAATTSSYAFTGLTKGTIYYVQAIAVGSINQRVASIIVNRVSRLFVTFTKKVQLAIPKL
ncbi:MAG: hypothetical protein ABI091_05870 [Ferruginibacter sp.]